VGRVRGISRRRKPVLRMQLGNGKELGITRWHPVFGSIGWQHAGSVAKCARLFSQQAMSSLWGIVSPEGRCGRDGLESAAVLRAVRQDQTRVLAPITYEGAEDLRELRPIISAMDRIEWRNSKPEGMEASSLLLDILLQEIEEPDALGHRHPQVER